MNAPLGTKDRPWKARITSINGDAAAISQGNVVCLSITDLSQVVLPSTATVAMAHPLFAGIAANDAAVGGIVEVICGGFVNSAILRLRTRAASTDSYASVAAAALSYGCLLTIDTVNNCLAYSTIGAAGLSPHVAVMLETLGSIASQASTTSITGTVSTTKIKVWIRALD